MDEYINKIINADCLDILKELPDKCVDVCIADPPYGTTSCKWDAIIPFESMWKELNRVVKDNGAICLFGSEPFSSLLRCSNLEMFKYDWIWDKKSAGNILCAKYQPLKQHEIISIFSKCTHNYFPIFTRGCRDRTKNKATSKKSDIFSCLKSGKFIHSDKNKPADARYPKSIIQVSKQSSESCNGKALHPTQKPVELIEYLIETYTNENEVILDFCSGSGTTAVACHNLHRRFICIEKDPEYYAASVERLEEVQAQGLLF